jgi:hypothetical protein
MKESVFGILQASLPKATLRDNHAVPHKNNRVANRNFGRGKRDNSDAGSAAESKSNAKRGNSYSSRGDD